MDIQLIISMNQETGQVNVSGPIGNKMLAYGLLELARDVIKDYKQETQGKLVPAKLKLPNA